MKEGNVGRMVRKEREREEKGRERCERSGGRGLKRLESGEDERGRREITGGREGKKEEVGTKEGERGRR